MNPCNQDSPNNGSVEIVAKDISIRLRKPGRIIFNFVGRNQATQTNKTCPVECNCPPSCEPCYPYDKCEWECETPEQVCEKPCETADECKDDEDIQSEVSSTSSNSSSSSSSESSTSSDSSSSSESTDKEEKEDSVVSEDEVVVLPEYCEDNQQVVNQSYEEYNEQTAENCEPANYQIVTMPDYKEEQTDCIEDTAESIEQTEENCEPAIYNVVTMPEYKDEQADCIEETPESIEQTEENCEPAIYKVVTMPEYKDEQAEDNDLIEENCFTVTTTYDNPTEENCVEETTENNEDCVTPFYETFVTSPEMCNNDEEEMEYVEEVEAVCEEPEQNYEEEFIDEGMEDECEINEITDFTGPTFIPEECPSRCNFEVNRIGWGNGFVIRESKVPSEFRLWNKKYTNQYLFGIENQHGCNPLFLKGETEVPRYACSTSVCHFLKMQSAPIPTSGLCGDHDGMLFELEPYRHGYLIRNVKFNKYVGSDDTHLTLCDRPWAKSWRVDHF